uniref:DEAD-box ATP-dependent RNA helicase 46 n=1 Tax=Noccaea caerulescens TaxID=107243 RepID=A0A1J3K9K0_NOCCA
MDGCAAPGLELIDIPETHDDLQKSSIVSRIYVEGYDTWLSGYELAISMKKHFASCGEVIHVHIPGYCESSSIISGLSRFALIYLRGEGADDKALELSGRRLELIGGSYSRGGNKLVVKPYPFRAKNPDPELARVLARTRKEDKMRSHTMLVDGYDISRPVDYLKRMLFKHFSQCGKVSYVQVFEDEENEALADRVAVLIIKGIHTIEKALQLRCVVEGLENVKVCEVAPPPKNGALCCGGPVMTWDPEFDATAPEDPNLPKPPPSFWSKRPSIIRYAPEDPSLPKPWKALVDLSSGFKFFWNTETNVTQYNLPNYNLRKRVRR